MGLGRYTFCSIDMYHHIYFASNMNILHLKIIEFQSILTCIIYHIFITAKLKKKITLGAYIRTMRIHMGYKLNFNWSIVKTRYDWNFFLLAFFCKTHLYAYPIYSISIYRYFQCIVPTLMPYKNCIQCPLPIC